MIIDGDCLFSRAIFIYKFTMNHKTRPNTLVLLLVFLTTFNPFAKSQEIDPLKQSGLEEVEKLSQQIHDISRQLWNYSETALLEAKSSQLLIDVLQKEGFSIESTIANMPTAFIASYGSGSPVIGILAEYDALPGIGNDVVPLKKAREDGNPNGHGCGHNLFGSASVNAAIAVKRMIEQKKLKGTLKLYGCPAEETLVGKVYMAKEGVFDDLDAALDWHPSIRTSVRTNKGLALNNFMIEFYGQAAHSAADPWNGRSALDAVEMLNYGVNMMREHIYPTARIHYVIPNAGDAPNVVPEYAKVWYYVRDTSRSNVIRNYEKILKIAEGAAMATFTDHKVTLLTGGHEYNLNEPLIHAVYKNMEIVGVPEYSEQDHEWGKKLQKSAGKEEKGFSEVIEEIPENWKKMVPYGGSTDAAEVSMITPTVAFSVATAPLGVPWHSWATAASHGREAAFRSAEVAAKILTLSAIDLYTNQQLREDAQKYFDQVTGGKPYVSPLPQDQLVTLPE